MKLNVKNEQGFTLVELMVVVAIIGVLSAVAIPNFKKYQAKAKSSEAKVQLAAAYTAQQAFYGDFGIYGNCLSYMGYDPSGEVASRYYAVGFNTAPTTLDTSAGVSAVNSGLSTECYAGTAVAPTWIAAADNVTRFDAGKTIGGAAAVLFTGGVTFNAVTALGAQTAADQTFTIAAQGNISTDKILNSDNSIFSMDQDKRLENTRSGY